MITKVSKKMVSHLLNSEPVEASFAATSPFPLERIVEYFGVVNYATTDRVVKEMRALLTRDPHKEIYLTVTSAGGPSGTALSFYDHVRTIMRPNLITIGSGDVDSSGVLIFLTGDRRYVTRHTTMLLHLAGRIFDSKKRYTSRELDAMGREDRLKDKQYAQVVAKRSHGRLTARAVLSLMKDDVVLEPEDIVDYGLADGILG